MTYSNDPKPNPYAHIPSPFPNIDFPVPYWINKLANMAIIGCLNPDLVYAELAVAAAMRMLWAVETPSTKQLIDHATGHSWLCGSKQIVKTTGEGAKIAESGTGRFIYGGFKGLDIAAYYAFMVSTGAKGVIDFGWFAKKFQRVCHGDQSRWKGIDAIGGWPADTGQLMTGPSFLNSQGDVFGQRLQIAEDEIGVMVAWCSFTDLFSTGGVMVEMSIVDEDTGQVYDKSVVDNRFNVSQFAICQFFTTEGRAARDTTLLLKVRFLQSISPRAVCAAGGCYTRAWEPTAADAPPYWNMKSMLNQHPKGFFT